MFNALVVNKDEDGKTSAAVQQLGLDSAEAHADVDDDSD